MNVKRGVGVVVLLGSVGLGVAACGNASGPPSSPGASAPPSSPSSSSASSPSPSTPATSPQASSPQAPVSTPPPTPAGTPPCQKTEMGVGTWKIVPGGEGAGHAVADLAFQNTSNRACTISGYPRVTLTDAAGTALPTTVTDYSPATVGVLTVAPSSWVHSEIQYDPHMPGPSEPTSGACEPATTTMLVRLPGDSVLEHVVVSPATTFCGRGDLTAKPFVPGAASAAGG